jgi:DNA-binding transcriptional regulator YhcF (GntR family)
MQKALAELEVQGLIHTQRTSGRTVTTNERLIMDLKERIAGGFIEQYFEGMKSLGIERDDAIHMLTARKSQSVPQAQSATIATNINTKEEVN